MRKRRALLSVILALVFLILTIGLTACLTDDEAYVIPEDREVSGLNLYCRSTGRRYALSGENFSTVEQGLRRVPKLYSAPFNNDVGNSADADFDYTISVTLAKKGLRKAKTFKVYVGVYVAASIIPSEQEQKSVGKAEVHIIGYYGVCDADFVNALQAIETTM